MKTAIMLGIGPLLLSTLTAFSLSGRPEASTRGLHRRDQRRDHRPAQR